MELPSQIEAVLFFKGDAVSVAELSQILGVSGEEVEQALTVLSESLNDRGLSLLRNGEEVALVTDGRVAGLIEDITRKELKKDLGKAGRETLAIILYKHPISKQDIDFIRGVNSATILRNLILRGLAQKKVDRSGRFLYYPTTELLASLGVTEISGLPEYEEMKTAIEELFEL